MDLAIDVLDSLVFDSLYAKYYPLPRNSLLRQIITLNVTQTIGGYFFYFFFASLSYYFIYDRSQMAHPKFLKNQIRKEIMVACKSIPIMSVIMTGPALVEVRGYSRAYRNVDEYGWGYFFLSIVLFLLFTDMCIYWIHRALHHPLLYTRIHKPHHLWKVPTPFASHAFHPLDGTSQAIPYHIFIWFFPMHAGLFLAMFIFVNCWTIMIHDGAYFLDSKIVNTTAHHTVHHLEFNYNYGQYFTIWDKIARSYREPTPLNTLFQNGWGKVNIGIKGRNGFGKAAEAAENGKDAWKYHQRLDSGVVGSDSDNESRKSTESGRLKKE